MSNKKNRPVGKAFCLVAKDLDDPTWVHIGAVWRTESGNLMVNVDALPLAWLNRPPEQAKVLIRLEQGHEISRTPRKGWTFNGSGLDPVDPNGQNEPPIT